MVSLFNEEDKVFINSLQTFGTVKYITKANGENVYYVIEDNEEQHHHFYQEHQISLLK